MSAIVALLREVERQIQDVKTLVGFGSIVLLIGLGAGLAKAEFTSLHVFGDGLCTTTGNIASPPLDAVFYGNRYCNGRVWVEVLAQWQGLAYVSSNNLSYFGHDSAELVDNVADFIPSPDVATALFVVWANNADFVEFMSINGPPYSEGDIPEWTSLINGSLTNHHRSLTNLYIKGVRTIILPNASDVTHVPFFGMSEENRNFVRARITEFNQQFSILLSNLTTSHPGLVIHEPDSFSLIDDVIANPSLYGITTTDIDAITDLYPPAFDGPGADYAFWDDLHPTAKLQMHLAELVQELLSPVKIVSITTLDSTNALGVVNVPVGRDGVVDGSTNLVDWAAVQPFTSTNTTQTISVPMSGTIEFYRLQFPFNWLWP